MNEGTKRKNSFFRKIQDILFLPSHAEAGTRFYIDYRYMSSGALTFLLEIYS